MKHYQQSLSTLTATMRETEKQNAKFECKKFTINHRKLSLKSRKENLIKCMGYFEIEHIGNPCFVMVAVNPKEYYEQFEGNSFNKKLKGINKCSPGMDFENYANRILALNDCDFFEKPKVVTKQVPRLTVIDSEMQQITLTKTKFSQFKDKRFYFSDAITSLPLSHSYLQDFINCKEKKGQRIEKYFWQEKHKLLAMENKVQLLNERISVYRQILNSAIQYFPLNQKDNFFMQRPTNI